MEKVLLNWKHLISWNGVSFFFFSLLPKLKPGLFWKVDEGTLQFHCGNNMGFSGVGLGLLWREKKGTGSVEVKSCSLPGLRNSSCLWGQLSVLQPWVQSGRGTPSILGDSGQHLCPRTGRRGEPQNTMETALSTHTLALTWFQLQQIQTRVLHFYSVSWASVWLELVAGRSILD